MINQLLFIMLKYWLFILHDPNTDTNTTNNVNNINKQKYSNMCTYNTFVTF